VGEVLRISDRVTILRNGRKVATVGTSNIIEQDILKLMMGTTVDETVGELNTPMESGDAVLYVRKLTTLPRTSTEVQLRDVSFEIYEGEVVGVTGLLGSGMYELGRALIGDAHVVGGEIIYLGKRMRIKSPNHANRLGILYIPEDRRIGLIYSQSIRFNVTLSELASSKRILINTQEERKRTSSLIERLRIEAPSIDALIRQLSGGNQQKSLIARIFTSRPRLVIINEPTVGIDLSTKFEIRRLISQLPRHGMSVLLISSDLDDLLSTAHRILIMRNGTVSSITKPNKDEVLSYL
jgi:ABC-type sugar transport system ATPase subunit